MLVEVMKLSKETIVYQSNPLVESRRDFSLIETRLFYIGLRDIAPKLTSKNTPWQGGHKDFPHTFIPAKDLIEIFGNDKYYNTLKNICRDFAKKTVEIKGVEDGDYEIYPVFAELSYKKSKGLTLEFNSKMAPWLLELADKPFTKLPFEQVWALRSSYAIRILELVLQYQNTKTHERIISLDDLKQYLGMPLDSYEGRTNTFKQRVIDKSVSDINEKTSYKIECDNVKDGRKIVGFKFKLYLPAELKKEKQKKQSRKALDMVKELADKKAISSDSEKDLKVETGMTDEQRKLGQKKSRELLARLKGEC
jgi:plasmid replication initiation protein